MSDESKEMLNDSLLIKATKDSYMKKEDLIKMIENLNFTEIENIRLSCITGYKIKVNNNGNKYVQTLGFEFDIN